MFDDSQRGIRDQPIAEPGDDTLGLTSYARALADLIRTSETPITIGIQGDWGSGKSSLMHLLQGEIGDGFLHVPLNTWQYAQMAQGADLSAWVLKALQESLTGPDANDARPFIRFLRRLGDRVKSVSAGPVTIDLSSEGQTITLEDVRRDFGKMVDERLRVEGSRAVVIYIDDLDRLAPVRAVEILEMLQTYLDVPGCVYVLACDYEIVVRGLRAKFDLSEDDLEGRSFFDKIIQVPFRMPITRYRIREYLSGLLRRIGWPARDEDLSDYEECLGHTIGFNPRGVKRLCNTCYLLKRVAELEAANQEEDDEAASLLESPVAMKILFGLVCLETGLPWAYREIHRSDDGTLGRLLLDPQQEQSLIADMAGGERGRVQAMMGFLLSLTRMLGEVAKTEVRRVDFVRALMSLSSVSSVGEASVAASARQVWTRDRFLEALETAEVSEGFKDLARRLLDLEQQTPLRATWGTGRSGAMILKIEKSGVLEVQLYGALRVRPDMVVRALGDEIGQSYLDGLSRLFPEPMEGSTYPMIPEADVEARAEEVLALVEDHVERWSRK